MDSFLEYLMVKKLTGKDIAIRALVVFAAVLLSLIAFVLCMAIRLIRPFSFFAVLCIGYLAYIFVKRQSIEFEYIFTNGDLDIDIIRGRRFRKRLAAIKCKDIRVMEKTTEIAAKTNMGTKTVNAVYDLKATETIYKIECAKEGGEELWIYFQPSEMLIKEMKRYNPRSIITE